MIVKLLLTTMKPNKNYTEQSSSFTATTVLLHIQHVSGSDAS